MDGTYESDFALWAEQQARALRDLARSGVNAPVDWENVVEEIESLGRSEKTALRSQIGRIIEHLMKIEASPAQDPRRGWRITIIRAREDCRRIMDDSPSLRRFLPDLVADETVRERAALRQTLAAYDEVPTKDLDSLGYSVEQVLGDWWP